MCGARQTSAVASQCRAESPAAASVARVLTLLLPVLFSPPLSRYATVLEEKGVCYLYIKTIERAHLPAKLWEKTRLHSNYATALAQITEALQFWPNFNVHKVR